MHFSLYSIMPLAALLAVVEAHGVILAAQGEAGSPPSVGFGVNDAIARNCTTINPCQLDATIIRDEEIAQNVVNSCGRTQLTGNIDVGENTENALAAGQVTQVRSGSQITVTIHQVNADGAGPYVCDLDEGSNSGDMSQNLTVTNNIPGSNGLSQAKAQDFNITVTMPDNFRCTGASTGDICTVRCRNNAVAGPFGGCFPVQQVDTTPNVNTPANIKTALTNEEVEDQVLKNLAALPAAIEANANAGSSEAEQNAAAVEAILGTPVTQSQPALTPSVVLGGNPADAVETGDAAAGGGNNGGNGNNAGGNGNTDDTQTGNGGNGGGRGGRGGRGGGN